MLFLFLKLLSACSCQAKYFFVTAEGSWEMDSAYTQEKKEQDYYLFKSLYAMVLKIPSN